MAAVATAGVLAATGGATATADVAAVVATGGAADGAVELAGAMIGVPASR